VPGARDPRQDRLLAALPKADWQRLAPLLEWVDQPLGKLLFESGRSVSHVVFPTTAIVALLYVMEDGASAQIAMVGNEGLVGVAAFMGGGSTPSEAVVQRRTATKDVSRALVRALSCRCDGLCGRPALTLDTRKQGKMDNIRTILARLGCALFATLTWLGTTEAAVTQDWAVVTQGQAGAMLALDKDNNAYVAGSVPRDTILLTKYSPTGAQLWERVFDNPLSREEANWVTLDPAGNPIVVGLTLSASTGVGQGIVVLKYDSAGNLLWQDIIAATFGGAVRAQTDPAGNVYVLGTAGAGLGRDLTTIKYSPSGARQWIRSYQQTPTSLHAPAAMTITAAGNVIVTGGGQATMNAVAYDPAGNQIWAKAISSATAANDVALGPQGEVYLVGGDLTPGAPKGILVVKHDASFNELWRKTYAVGGYAIRAAVDGLGNLIATGVTPNAYFNWVTVKLDASGTLLWSRITDKQPSPDEYPLALAIGPDNAIYVTGEAGWLSTTFGNVTTYLGATTEKFAPDGTPQWSTQAQIPMRGRGIQLGSNGSIFVVGDGPRALLHYTQDGNGTPLPTAVAAANRVLGPEPLSVTFSANGSTGAIVGYNWVFGDGSGSFETNPTHVYAAGTYTASLKVTDNVGGSATSAPITITANPAAPPPPAPVSVNFSSTTVKGGKSVGAAAFIAFPVPAPTALTLTLSSSAPGVASVPATLQLPVGANRANFTVKTTVVRRDTVVTITASDAAGRAAGTLTVLRN
jgi:PKD repeat protein